MITVKQVREAGFSFIEGDLVHRKDIDEFVPVSQCEVNWINNKIIDTDDSEVKEFAWRSLSNYCPELQELPGDLIIEIEYPEIPESFNWTVKEAVRILNTPFRHVRSWRPSTANWLSHQSEKSAVERAPDAIQTTADNLVKSLTRSLPEVGHKFKFNEEEGQLPEKFSWLISEKYGWEHNDEIEVVKHIENHEGEMVAVCLNTQPDVLNSACLTADFFETEAERNERELEEMTEYVCDELFAVSAQECREDVVATVYAMLAGGYRKAVTNE